MVSPGARATHGWVSTSRWVVERGARDLARLRELAPRVVGDLDELRCEPVAGRGPEAIGSEEQLAAGIDALLFALVQLARHGPRP